MTQETRSRPLKPLLDTLLPGDRTWPAAGDVIADLAVPDDARALSRHVAALTPAARAAEVAAFEANDPEAFAALFRAVADAYYATPEAARILARRAAASPADTTGPPFDRSLLDRIVREQRGRRRL